MLRWQVKACSLGWAVKTSEEKEELSKLPVKAPMFSCTNAVSYPRTSDALALNTSGGQEARCHSRYKHSLAVGQGSAGAQLCYLLTV